MLPGLQPTHSEHEPEPAVKEPPSVQPTRSEHDPEPAVVEPPSEEMEQTAGVATEEQPASVPEVDSPAQQPEPVEQNAAPEASAEKVDHPLLEQPEPVEQNAAGEASAEDVDHPMQTQAAPTSAAVIWGSAAGLCAIAASVFAVVRIMNQADESEGLEDGDIDDFDDGEGPCGVPRYMLWKFDHMKVWCDTELFFVMCLSSFCALQGMLVVGIDCCTILPQ